MGLGYMGIIYKESIGFRLSWSVWLKVLLILLAESIMLLGSESKFKCLTTFLSAIA